MPIQGDGKERFIAVNILPPHPSQGDVVALLDAQIENAKRMGFTHAWLNPLYVVPPETVCERRCYDTGLFTQLSGSLYAPDDLQTIREEFKIEDIRNINAKARDSHFFILADFVWKHVSVNSSLLKKNPKWFGARVKDIIEYNFEAQSQFSLIIAYLKKAIDLLLSKDQGYGFAGLRIDAASHLTPKVRRELYEHVRKHYPHAIIFEEVLFDRAHGEGIASLLSDASTCGLTSDFVTSNLYFQRTDVFGGIKRPQDMGDSEKIQLAAGNGISFTGNHDHFSVGGGALLNLVLKNAQEDTNFASLEGFEDFVKFASKVSVSMLTKSDNPKVDVFEKYLDAIKKGEYRDKGMESIDAVQQQCLRYVLPFANEIARTLLEKAAPPALLEKFRLEMFENIATRTMASMSGYFFLYSELLSPFENPRIFFNKNGNPLPSLLLTAKDLKKEEDVTYNVYEAMLANKKLYDNFSNFEKKYSLFKEPKKGKKRGETTPELTDDVNVLRIWLPFIIEFLRNNPEYNKYSFYQNEKSVDEKIKSLHARLGTELFIQEINEIYSALTTMKCADYHTFMSSDQYKIVVRCSDDTTDIIVLNLNSGVQKTIFDSLDLEKIALWFQSRLFPQQSFTLHGKAAVVGLSAPFTAESKTYPASGYIDYWMAQGKGVELEDSYNRIIGKKANHTTNLYLGYGFDLRYGEHISERMVKKHLQTARDVEYAAFENFDSPLVIEPIEKEGSDSGIESSHSEDRTPTPAVIQSLEGAHALLFRDNYKVIVRYTSDSSTEVVILNSNLSGPKIIFDDKDLEKIALWFQLKLFPSHSCIGEIMSLAHPFSAEAKNLPSVTYTKYWQEQNGALFDESYTRITGEKLNHSTHFYVGNGFDLQLGSHLNKERVMKQLQCESGHDEAAKVADAKMLRDLGLEMVNLDVSISTPNAEGVALGGLTRTSRRLSRPSSFCFFGNPDAQQTDLIRPTPLVVKKNP